MTLSHPPSHHTPQALPLYHHFCRAFPRVKPLQALVMANYKHWYARTAGGLEGGGGGGSGPHLPCVLAMPATRLPFYSLPALRVPTCPGSAWIYLDMYPCAPPSRAPRTSLPSLLLSARRITVQQQQAEGRTAPKTAE